MQSKAERLKQARIEAGYRSAAEAAEALGVNYVTYVAHENGNSGFRTDSAEKYARRFGVTLEWLLTGRGDHAKVGAIPLRIEVIGLPVLGNIQAGHWLETSFAEEMGVAPELLPVARDERFPRARQYALRVLGDSMDLEYPDGSYVTCVDFAESGLPIVDGLTVHVERRRFDGQMIEITLKRVEKRGKEFILVPRSSNPQWQPLTFDNSNAEIVIRGIVTGGWRQTPLPKFPARS